MDEPKILLAELADLEELVNPSTADDSDDGGLDSYAGIGFVDELYASVDDEEVRSSNIGRDDFKIRHSSGNFKMKPTVLTLVDHFLAQTNESNFDASQALEMFQRRYTMDYGRRASGSKAADPDDKYFPIFHLGMIGIVGRPLRPITNRSGFFDKVTFTLRYWHSSYVGKHVTTNLPFDIRNRTFRIATAASGNSGSS
ncbi:uncharacterized protein NECHADRAFT_89231 [Fusarium vanettenii 77-13-4]|uniref:Uncharacterized protein n=1 Tax=Fusarium vanettenii (strain ATCC MYA-4622 / CBS 123669 / FGSC 9596 / NRRL 45880 / 77-13-4) TaxID=660122 RepID=C7ZQK6_FUSV7|nr:uncharacterized protein NECHADRAFT_89231 [Fusarium vanettenii 77-13-4]EEU33694.1 hypothetical protein NECHADRAFT_89231 [Fusarium vanettenii 77-13-4]